MSTLKPGVAVSSPSEAATRSWYAFRHYNPGSAQDPRLCYLSGYSRAVRDMLADQFEFGGWDTLTRRMLEVMEELLVERQAMRLVAEEESRPCRGPADGDVA
jgi:hypothetical protein